MDLENRTCRICGETKPLERFEIVKSPRGNGRRRTCRECRHQQHISSGAYARYKEKRKQIRRTVPHPHLYKWYGITADDYLSMHETQDGRCKICLRTQQEATTDKWWLCVDHDHLTGKVRALLCDRCNRMLGQSKDDPSLLERGADYLRSFQEALV